MERWLSPRVGLALVAGLYLLSFPYHPGLRSPNELCRLWQARSIIDHHQVSIDQTMREFGPVGDRSCTLTVLVTENGVEKEQLFSCVQGQPPGRVIAQHRYPSKAPLVSFLAAPVYWLLKQVQDPVPELAQVFFSRLLVAVFPTLLLMVLLRRYLREVLPPTTADLLVVAYGLGTMAFSFGELFFSHQLTAALLFAAFMVVRAVELQRVGEWGYVAAGALCGAVVMTEYTGALGVVCLAAWVVVRRFGRWPALARAVVFVVLGSAPFLGGLMAYHQACFGSPLTSGYKFLDDAAYQHWHVGGFLGIRWPDPLVLLLSGFSPLRGLFTMSPFLLLAFWGLKPLKQIDRSVWLFVLVLLFGNAWFTAGFDYTSWGWTVGPRHLTPLVPFLLYPVGLALERLRAKGGVWQSLAAGLLVSSVLFSGLLGFVVYVPDDVTTAMFGLVVPVLTSAHLPVSWLVALGLTNPWSGGLLLVMLAALAAWVTGRELKAGAKLGVIVAVVVVHFGVIRLVTKNDDHDQHAQQLLEEVWLAPNGARFSLFR
jgi:hypothetical protein